MPQPQGKLRADLLMLRLGLAPSRQLAQALIMAGKVWLQQRRIDKPGTLLANDSKLYLRTPPSPWVARSAEKLLAAIDHFQYPVQGRNIMDVGSSTGGFTQVLLSHNANKVLAVDVGRALLHPKLCQDNRITVLENCNARYLVPEQLPFAVSAATIDVSFIGLRTILPAILGLLPPRAWLLALVKPQFEAGRHQVGRGGIVMQPEVKTQAWQKIQHWLQQKGYHCDGVLAAPVQGRGGNQEFMLGAKRL